MQKYKQKFEPQSDSVVFFRKQAKSSVVPDSDVVAGLGKGCPGDVEPGACGEELVGVRTLFQKVHKAVELH